VFLDYPRAKQIFESPQVIQVKYRGRPVWIETFDSNKNGWPVSYGEQGKSAYFQSDIFEGQYLVNGQQKKEGNTIIKRLIPLDLEMVFMTSIEVARIPRNASRKTLISYSILI